MLAVPGLLPPLVVLLNELPVDALPAGFAPPVVAAPLPFAAGVAAGVAPGVAAGKDVIGVGRSGIGFAMTPATSSVTFASVAFLFRNL